MMMECLLGDLKVKEQRHQFQVGWISRNLTLNRGVLKKTKSYALKVADVVRAYVWGENKGQAI